MEVTKTVEDPNEWSLYSDPLDDWSMYVPPGWERYHRSNSIIFAGIAADGQAASVNVSAQTVPIQTTIIDYSDFYVRDITAKNLSVYEYRHINNILTKQEYSEIRHNRKFSQEPLMDEILAHVYKTEDKIVVVQGDILFRAKPTQLNWYPVQEMLNSFRIESAAEIRFP